MLLGEIANSDRCQQHQPNGNHMNPAFAIFVCLLGSRLHFWRLNHTRSITRPRSSTCTSPGLHLYLTEVGQSVVKPSHLWSLSNDRKDKIRNTSRHSFGDDWWGAKTKQSRYSSVVRGASWGCSVTSQERLPREIDLGHAVEILLLKWPGKALRFSCWWKLLGRSVPGIPARAATQDQDKQHEDKDRAVVKSLQQRSMTACWCDGV